MQKLEELNSKCKAGVFIEINNHKSYYQSVREYIEEAVENGKYDEYDIADGLIDSAEISGVIVELAFYPITPVGFCSIVDSDIEAAVDRALKYMEQFEVESVSEQTQ
jgi:hypothetical protein